MDRRKVELVFRTVGERTSDIALELAKKHIQPDVVHIIDNVKPFMKAMEMQMEIEYTGDYIVFMDSDCLILEDMREFLERTTEAFIDCYVVDRFRGRIHLGVHITRRDLVEEMQRTVVPPDDLKYILRPESRRRNFALQKLGLTKSFITFFILHDFCQSTEHVWAKYALRELRSRVELQRIRLEKAMDTWRDDELDHVVAKHAVEFTRKHIPDNSDSLAVDAYIRELPEFAAKALKELGLEEKGPLTMEEVDAFAASEYVKDVRTIPQNKIFCIGLSRTGTKSLSKALAILGYDIIHYPADEDTYEELAFGNYQLSILDHYDGVSDITASAFFRELDEQYPEAKFILTIRDREEWLDGMEKHWYSRIPFEENEEADPTRAIHMKMRRFLRASMYGTYVFNRRRLGNVYDRHIAEVREYFSGEKSDRFLEMNFFQGDGWDELCGFLGVPVPDEEFVHVRKKKELTGVKSDS